MHPEIRKYCNHISKAHTEVLRLDKRTGTRFWDLPAVASVCMDNSGKKRKRGYSHYYGNTTWNFVLQQVMTRISPMGHGNRNCSNPIGNCAEQHSANRYMNHYNENKINKLYFTESVRPRTMQIIPACKNCTTIFPNL